MERQLILKNIMTAHEWAKNADKVHYKFNSDHYYAEIKMQEILTQRLTVARDSEDFVGKYYSKEWFRTHVLHQTEAEIQVQDDQIAKEAEEEGGDEEGDEGGDEGGYGGEEEKDIDLGNDSSKLHELATIRDKRYG